MTLAGLCLLSGCAGPHSPTPEVIPTDGVHISGALSSMYPITSGATCSSFSGELAISANPRAGEPGFGVVVANFTGPNTYTDVGWPPQGHSTLYVSYGGRTWRAQSGLISVKSVGNVTVSGSLWSSHLREVDGSTTVNAAGSWTCRIVTSEPPPTLPSPGPIVYPSASPSPVGDPLPRRVLPPATVLPVADLCSAPVQKLQDGNAGPLFCRSGALNVEAWRYFAPSNPHVMALAHNATIKEVQAAVCVDTGQGHMTSAQEDGAYALAAAYHGWASGFEPSWFVSRGGCH